MKFFNKISKEIIDKYILNHKKIAIVGGSSSLLKEDYGSFIDQHDFVIRFNRSPTKGYEKYVGSKTSLRVMGEQFFLNKSEQYPDENINFEYLVKNVHNTNLLVLCINNIQDVKKNNKFSKTNILSYLDTSINHKLKFHLISKFNYLKKFKFYFDNSDLTSGCLILSLLVYHNINPSIFGFDFFKSQSNYSMYYSNHIEKSIIHKFTLEQELLSVIKKRGLAKFY